MTKTDGVAQACYDAEFQLRNILTIADETENRAYDFYGSTFTLPIERKFASIESIETYCNVVLKLGQVHARYGPRAAKPVTVRHRRGDLAAHYETLGSVIAVNTNGARWALRELVVLHELAHHLTPYEGHGDKWQRAFCYLVSECIGPEIGIILYSMMDKNLR